MLGGRLLAMPGASYVSAQVGNAGSAYAPLGQGGAVAGDFALWINSNPPNSSWANIGTGVTPIHGKVLNAADLTASSALSDSWGVVIYRDVTSAAPRSASGFARALGHMGMAAVFAGADYQITSPADAQKRVKTSSAPLFVFLDMVPPGASYTDGTVFAPGGDSSWTVIELLRN